ncbi:GNAT family N-acetyltransferase [Neptunicella sp. SCSIO 80796]|uniref:GNAT family N-acetyltransferase n=1 Tax=Neptunicella plasticusilytica TaxID=3117012 RepID=UPI003A4D5C56
MQWQVFPIQQYPTDLWQDWQHLADQHHAGNPMLGSIFVKLLVEFFGTELYVARGEQDSNLVALMLLEKGRKGIWRGFKPSQAQITLLVMDKEISPCIYQLPSVLPGLCLKIDIFGLDSSEHSVWIDAAKNKQHYATNVQLKRFKEFTQYWHPRPKNLRKNISRYFNKLETDECSVNYVAITKPEDIKRSVDRYGILESAGWKGKNGTALHPSNLQGQFYRELLNLSAEAGSALVFETYLNDELSASRLCIFCDNKFVILKTTFDEDFKKYSLGKLNLYKLIEYVHQSVTCTHIDFYTNASKEQIDWSTEQRPMYNISIYPNHLIDKLMPMLSTMRSKLKQLARVQAS